MKITLSNINSKIIEDYSNYENDDVVTILSDVCKQIDTLGLATLDFFFQADDKVFCNVNFTYDFTSIATELLDLIDWLEDPGNTDFFCLYFYELKRKIVFSYKDKDLLQYKIIKDKDSTIINSNTIIKSRLFLLTKKVIENFYSLLARNFPKATQIFIQEDFLLIQE